MPVGGGIVRRTRVVAHNGRRGSSIGASMKLKMEEKIVSIEV